MCLREKFKNKTHRHIENIDGSIRSLYDRVIKKCVTENEHEYHKGRYKMKL